MIFPFFFFLSVVYVFKAYLFGSSHSVSCFFMPCAPQSISETDQAGTLFVGLALFVGVEILPPLYATFKKRYVEGRQFEQSVDRSITNGAMRRLVDGSLRSLVGGNGPVPTTRRVNSGIELEEGVYSGS
ncbi:hypothetical protein B0J14DRAFT_585047 [Halenospora varia]|nr:hypothetical protein B0J14DRAFT_585047 [Halenospora varia]